MEQSNLLSPRLIEQIRDGEAILFLGAGATFGAVGANGEKPLSADALRDYLADKFLGGGLKDRPLAEVAEYAKNEASLNEVQSAVYSVFEPLRPVDFHRLIAKFRWHSIITTNYDLIVEQAYAECPKPLQQLTKIIREGDAANNTLGEATKVPYLKLHGCLSVIDDPDIPLILSTEEYARHQKGRESLFRMFSDWARSRPIIFCGYNIGDPNIQQILFDLGDQSINRPHYAVINPNLNDFDLRYWQSRRFFPVKQTFENFIRALDRQIPENNRILSTLRTPNASSIQPRVVYGQPSVKLLAYLEQELVHVRSGMPTSGTDPKDFFRGKGNSWFPIQNNLDIERSVTDHILIDSILEVPQDNRLQAYLIAGHAGSGKSVTLRRVAWNAATEHDKFVLWLEETGKIQITKIRELYNLVDERIFIFIEDVVPHSSDVEYFCQIMAREKIPVTLFLGARTNEWNIVGGNLEATLTKNYELEKLRNFEIKQLLESLERHKCLGYLETLPEEDRIDYFRLTADRQLLVALHEATSGKSFEEIVIDEFNNIVPREAQLLYLDVCTFHRFKVGLRAGLVSRVSGITLGYFEKRLFQPLEHVVGVYLDTLSKDYAYRSRHPVIADMIFKKVLDDPENRTEQIIRLVQSMNVDFQSDHIAFEQMIRGRDLAELFDDRVLVDRIFEAASKAIASEAHIQHQRAVFELHHPNGNLMRALQAVNKAEETTGQKKSAIRHTKAMVLRKLALEAQSSTERDKLRVKAKEILKKLVRQAGTPYSYHTLGQLCLDECREYLAEAEDIDNGIENLRERRIGELVSEIERVIQKGLKVYPNESYLLELERQLAKLINDKPRAENALSKAIEMRPDNGFLAVRMARHLKGKENLEGAKRVLVQCLERNPSDANARIELAKLLIEEDERKYHDVICDHLRRVFSTGDTNYEARFWFARQQFLYGSLAVAQEQFQDLAKAKISPKAKQKLRGKVRDQNGKNMIFMGTVKIKHENYCFVTVQGIQGNIFMHSNSFADSQWESVTTRSDIEFELAFTYQGSRGIPANYK